MKTIIKSLVIIAMLTSLACSAFSEGTVISLQKNGKKVKIKPIKHISIKDVAPEMIAKPVTPGGALTLSDCYYLALLQSENIAISEDQIRVTEAHFLQALSIVLPHVSFVSTDTQTQKPGDAGQSAFSNSSASKGSERRINTTQTLFNGFKAIAAIKGSGAELYQRLNEMKRAEQLLLIDVSNAFYLLLEKQSDIKVINKTRAALTSRIKELRDREKVGRSRLSEVVNAKTQLFNVESSLEVSKSQEDIARQILEFLVGKKVGQVIDTYKLPLSLMPQDYYASKSLLRPDVEAAKFAWELARREAQIVDSDFLPTVSLENNIYTQRTGANKGSDWDLMLKIDVPIFDGGLTIGRSDEARLMAKESELTFMRTKRQAPYDIREAYIGLDAAMRVYNALTKSYKMAKLNYYLQTKDYERSLVSNLDVLTSIQTLQDVQRNYIKALYEAKRLYWELKVAIGEEISETFNDVI